MYEEYFRLSDAPFRLNPDPRFFYGSRSHNKAMAYLHYGLKQAEGFIVITGPVGAGKSMIIGHLLDQLNASNVVAANLLTSNIKPQDLLSQILSAFRIEPETKGRTGEIEAFEDYLFDQLNRGRRVLLIIDEAQNLPFNTLEELRMLSNIDYEGTPLFQVFLVGQPEFRATMESDRLEQLRQRVIASYHLENLTEEETRDYILHRLCIAGWEDDPAFSDEAYKSIYEETEGLPRRINTLCNRILLYCSLEEQHEVTRAVVKIVCDELKEEKLAAKRAADPAPKPVKVDEQEPAEAPDLSKTDNTSQENEDNEDTQPVEPESVVEAQQPKPIPPAPADNVVVSIDSAREQGEKPMEKVSLKEDPSDELSTSKPDPQTGQQVMTSAMSVLDRLRAKKASAQSDDRQDATLNEVASAIAAAVDKTHQSTDEAKASAETKAGGETLPDWRQGLMKSVDETREELKEANANIVHLKNAASGRKKNSDERRQKISDGLARAEALLEEVRAAQE
ncbi:XrtA/PEP-CTERM system-associated ATPase [Hyphococcus sp.]|uniref:XrtA/PEP-CTERM system-associated ATPase n=1 Tax=Hyphococcus sp. TaxID=2038636 RepID=UPI003CCB770A